MQPMQIKPLDQQQPANAVPSGGGLDENGLWGRVLAMSAAQNFMQMADNTKSVTGQSPIASFLHIVDQLNNITNLDANGNPKQQQGGQPVQPGQVPPPEGQPKTPDETNKKNKEKGGLGGKGSAFNNFMAALDNFSHLFTDGNVK
jgi:hypothetical protein